LEGQIQALHWEKREAAELLQQERRASVEALCLSVEKRVEAEMALAELRQQETAWAQEKREVAEASWSTMEALVGALTSVGVHAPAPSHDRDDTIGSLGWICAATAIVGPAVQGFENICFQLTYRLVLLLPHRAGAVPGGFEGKKPQVPDLPTEVHDLGSDLDVSRVPKSVGSSLRCSGRPMAPG
jgi:hypothetical protein